MVSQVILHTTYFLKQCGTITPFFLLKKNKHTHIQGRGKDVLIQRHTKLYSKAMIIFKGGWDKLYCTQHTFLSNMGQQTKDLDLSPLKSKFKSKGSKQIIKEFLYII